MSVDVTVCHLHKESSLLSFNTSDGDRCWSITNITISSCVGVCESHDGLRLRPVTGAAFRLKLSAYHEQDCGCCTGVGDWVQQPVLCDRAGTTTVELYKYTDCACVTCEAIESLPAGYT